MSGINKAGSGGGGPFVPVCATYATAGDLEVATLAETLDGTYLGGSGCPLAVNPINQKVREETATGALFANFATGVTLVSGFGTDAVELQSERSGVPRKASGSHALAVGQDNLASGTNSQAIGETNDATSGAALAVGSYNTASGSDSVAIGSSNTAGVGGSTVAIGSGNSASYLNDIAIGRSNTASGGDSVVIGAYGDDFGYAGSVVIGSLTASGGTNSVSVGTGATAYTYGVAIGYDSSTLGVSATAVGHDASATGYQATALGYGAYSAIDNSVNQAGPTLLRRSDGFLTIADAVRAFSTNETMIWTDVIDLTAVADHTITLPASAHFRLTEVGIELTELTGAITTQPTVRFGITGTPAKYMAATTTTLLVAALRRERYNTLLEDQGETSLVFGITVGAVVATSMSGRAYFKGVWIEDQ
jgi:hypothetical protein